MEYENTRSGELGTVRKEWVEYVLVHISLFIVRYFLPFLVYLLNQTYLYFLYQSYFMGLIIF